MLTIDLESLQLIISKYDETSYIIFDCDLIPVLVSNNKIPQTKVDFYSCRKSLLDFLETIFKIEISKISTVSNENISGKHLVIHFRKEI